MWSPKGDEKLYKITKPGAKYSRIENRGGKPFAQIYTGFDARNAHYPSEILLSEKAASQLEPLLRLVPTNRTRPRVEIKPDKEPVVDEVVVPEDWEGLPADSRKSLAEQISGGEVTRAKDADVIIKDYLNGKADAS